VVCLGTWAALSQAATARRRHITESFSKAVEQLGSDKIEVRLGGIYTLERMSHESKVEYLRGAHLEGEADLRGARLDGADLRAANLEKANLVRAHLEGANLMGAHLKGASLWLANLEGANLWGTNLKGTNLEWADLRGANLEGAKKVSQQQLNSAFGNSKTRLPAGVSRPTHWPNIKALADHPRSEQP
jgi:uncharacterized protein YjbI with pentapeptide repeats